MRHDNRETVQAGRLGALGRAAACTALLLAATVTHAQSSYNDNQDALLQAIRPTSLGGSNICPNLRGIYNTSGRDGMPADQYQLFDACAGVLNANVTAGARGNALQQLTGEELSAAQTTTVDFGGMQRANIAQRLLSLRQARGGSTVATLTPAERDVFALATGGAAGDDGLSGGRLGVFLNGRVGSGSKDTTDFEAGYDVDTTGITAGLDFRVSEQFVVGGAVSYGSTEADFDSGSASLSGGATETDGYSVALFGSWYGEKYYFDVIASFGQLDVESTRRISYTLSEAELNDPNPAVDLTETWDATARGETDSDLFSAGVSFGYDFGSGPWRIGPVLSINYLDVSVDGFTETGAPGLNLAYGKQSAESLQLQAGLDVGYAAGMSWGVLTPYARVTYVSEQENDAQLIGVRYVSDPLGVVFAVRSDEPDTSFIRWGVGLSALFANGFAAFVDYDAVSSLDTVDYGEVTAGIRFAFR